MSSDPQTWLFFSVDIVGSTAYKQKTPEAKTWLKTFTTFYVDFPKFLSDFLKRRQNTPKGEDVRDDLVLWKPKGDELFFKTSIKTRREIVFTAQAFKDALAAYKVKKNYEDREGNPTSLLGLGLNLKGACFAAVTPFPNEYLGDLEEIEDLLFKNEYIGPAIDTGFRILEHMSPDVFILSVEVAYAFLTVLCEGDDNKRKIKVKKADMGFRFVDFLPFKGVWEGVGYPLFAMVNEKKNALEARDDLNELFDNSIQTKINDMTLGEIIGPLQKVLTSKDLTAFLWLDPRSEPHYHEFLNKHLKESIVNIEEMEKAKATAQKGEKQDSEAQDMLSPADIANMAKIIQR